MSDVFAAPKSQPAKPYVLGRISGGELPPLGVIFSQTTAEFMDNMSPYVMAGLGMFCIQVPAIFVMIFVMYAGMFGVMFGGMLGSILAGAAVAQAAGEDIGGLVMALGYVATMLFAVAAMLGLVAIMSAALAPCAASLQREVAAHQRGEGELGFGSAFKQMGQDLVPTLIITALVLTGIFVGAMFCYIPGFALSFLLMFAAPLVYLHRQSPIAALRMSYGKVMAAPGPHLILWLAFLGIGMVANYVPILGMMFMTAMHVRVYRNLFGDGDEPVLA